MVLANALVLKRHTDAGIYPRRCRFGLGKVLGTLIWGTFIDIGIGPIYGMSWMSGDW
jgi:hypothetical protein